MWDENLKKELKEIGSGIVNSNHVMGQGRCRAFVNTEGKYQNPYRAENVSSSWNVRLCKTDLLHAVQ
jgi:hypothetical protein